MINQVIEKYKIVRLIGQGGMARVYEGIHIHLGKRVAIKILNEELVRKTSIRKRFENEAKIMADLEHPNIVKILDYIEKDNLLAIVMELLQGQTLTDYIKRKGALNKSEINKIFLQVLDAFHLAHRKGIIHRDIKPSNIYLETHRNNNVKILDFGIAKLLSSDLSMTSTGTQMGSPLYMSPEQVKDSSHITHLSDIYSLGVVLYHMVSGKPPYDTTTLSRFDIFNKIVYEPLPPLRRFVEYNPVIQKATQKDPKLRYRNCAEFARDIQKIAAGKGPSHASTQIMAPSSAEKVKRHTPPPGRHAYRPHIKTSPSYRKSSETLRTSFEKPARKKGFPFFTALLILLLLGALGGGGYWYWKNYYGATTEEETFAVVEENETEEKSPELITETPAPEKEDKTLKKVPFDLKINENADLTSLIPSENGNIIAAGYAADNIRPWTKKLNYSGDIIKSWTDLPYPGYQIIRMVKTGKNTYVLLLNDPARKKAMLLEITGNAITGRLDLNLPARYNLTAMGKGSDGHILIGGTAKIKGRSKEPFLVFVNSDLSQGETVFIPGSSRTDKIWKILPRGKNYLLGGVKASTGWLAEMNRDGTLLWEKKFPKTKDIRDMVRVNGKLFVTGETITQSGPNDEISIYLMQLSEEGNKLQDSPQTFKHKNYLVSVPRLVATRDRLLLGANETSENDRQSVWILTFDRAGNHIDEKTYREPGKSVRLKTLGADDDGVLMGMSVEDDNEINPRIVKFYPASL